MFNNDYPNNNINNLYGTNKIKETKNDNIIRKELMASDSSVLHNMNEMKKGPYKLEYPMSNQRYDLGNEKSSLPDNKVDNEPDAQKAGNGKYNINPNHMHKINAIFIGRFKCGKF